MDQVPYMYCLGEYLFHCLPLIGLQQLAFLDCFYVSPYHFYCFLQLSLVLVSSLLVTYPGYSYTENIQQCLIVMPLGGKCGEMLLTSNNWQRPGMLPNILQGLERPPQQRITWPQTSIVLRLNSPAGLRGLGLCWEFSSSTYCFIYFRYVVPVSMQYYMSTFNRN